MRKTVSSVFSGDTFRNILMVCAVIVTVAGMFAVSSLAFWLKIQFANWMFGG